MPRKFSQRSRLYGAGVYGPFNVDNFTRNDTEKLVMTLTVEDWPDVPLAVRASIMFWDPDHEVTIPGPPDPVTGDPTYEVVKEPLQVGGGIFTWPGRPTGWDGALMAEVTAEVQVPRIGGEKARVAQGQVTMEAVVPVRSAVTLEAV